MIAMRFGRPFVLLVLVLTFCAGQSSTAYAASADDAFVPKENRKGAPRVSLPDLDGQKKQLSQLKGKVVVVNFWATWCGPCKAEMPEFTKVHAEYRDRGVEFIGAANETRAARDKVQEFVRRLEIQFPIWLEASLDHMEAFKVGPGLPATVIVDSQGRVAARITGVTDAAQLRALLDRILLEATPTAASAGGR
jgi:thiol-disulfide isomerase/thioredoxin